MAARILIILLLSCSFLYAADNKCISCHENVCLNKPDNCISCHRGDSSTSRKDIAHYKLIKGKYASYTDKSNPKTQKGIKIIEKAACTRCHNIGKSGATLASDLNSAVKRLTTDEIIKSIKEPVINMPLFQFNDEDMEALITGIYYYTIPRSPLARKISPGRRGAYAKKDQSWDWSFLRRLKRRAESALQMRSLTLAFLPTRSRR